MSNAPKRHGGDWPLDDVVAGLRAARQAWREHHRPHEPRGRELPSTEVLDGIVQGLRGVLFPLRLGPPTLRPEAEDYYIGHTLDTQLQALRQQVLLELTAAAGADPADPEMLARADQVTADFARELPTIRRLLDADVLAAFQGDPAARSVDEVLLCYPGIAAMIHHRLAHKLYTLGVPLLARIVAELAHSRTGIDIHPGATIGPGLFIDHGTGVVIGETAVIGERVRIYQAVTLGARSFPTDEQGQIRKGAPRHPVVEDDVTIYAGATILGRITLGKGSVIGGNVWLTRSVEPGSHVSQANSQSQVPGLV
ncbi:serine O-acetyltransferase EpsC [Roseateles depolymerans]|uniref:serine O-acetyltransferase n=1 Tax=Roseateles depolymerans TaxID=76731 RepID=A0A0U3MEZ4_9BURK|nr:serine O-acetyltransferase EpsC [Roseateles depolymerans]ALV06921.1 Serine O-acetyltransferase [Roseateles depolymerans]REG19901.1 serine O-acetyltransferase [Roseateles depolymerans]